MAKAGRPRRVDVPRDDKGRILRSFRKSQEPDPTSLNKWNRIKEGMLQEVADPRLGTLWGRMFLIGDPRSITAAEFLAANRLSGILAAYDGVVLGISRSVRSPILGDDVAGGGPEPGQDEIRGVINAMMEAEGVLGEAGADVAHATKTLCRDESAALGDLAALGLQALVAHWKIDAGAVTKKRAAAAVERNGG